MPSVICETLTEFQGNRSFGFSFSVHCKRTALVDHCCPRSCPQYNTRALWFDSRSRWALIGGTATLASDGSVMASPYSQSTQLLVLLQSTFRWHSDIEGQADGLTRGEIERESECVRERERVEVHNWHNKTDFLPDFFLPDFFFLIHHGKFQQHEIRVKSWEICPHCLSSEL